MTGQSLVAKAKWSVSSYLFLASVSTPGVRFFFGGTYTGMREFKRYHGITIPQICALTENLSLFNKTGSGRDYKLKRT